MEQPVLNKKDFEKNIVPFLMEALKYKNPMQVPRIEKVVINAGIGEMAQDKNLIESVRDELMIITGQRPVLTRAKKAISNFKIRIGAPVGYKVTLRGNIMYEFIYRLINFSIPRIRDFRGLAMTGFDERGNYSLGIKEQAIFPELDLDKMPMSHGLNICFVTTAKTKDEGAKLLEAFGMPFTKTG